jgi:hypothetical protein
LLDLFINVNGRTETQMAAASSATPGAVRTSDVRAPATADRFTEAKNGFKTTEFFAMLALVVAILVATYVDSDDTLGHSQGWLYASIVAAAYIVSRGLAKLGVREPENDR